jgi:hypothetical protein
MAESTLKQKVHQRRIAVELSPANWTKHGCFYLVKTSKPSLLGPKLYAVYSTAAVYFTAGAFSFVVFCF